VARWPGKVKAGQIAHSPAHITDLMATFVEVSGAKYPDEVDGNAIPAMEGESLFPALQGKDWERERPICIEHEGNCAVRDGQWKLVRKYPGDWELYDMEADRTELNDLAAGNRDRVERMVKVYEEFTERAGVKPWDHMLERINASDWVKGDAAVGAVRPGGYA
jgi:arylsulfatase